MNPGHYLDLAKLWIEQVKAGTFLPGTTGEAECRSAINRAYYSAFLVATALYDAIGIQAPSTGKCHVVVQQAFNNSGDLELIAVGVQLGTLYSERRRADYEMSDARAERIEQAALVAGIAETTIAKLAKRRGEYEKDVTKKTALASTILAWAKQAAQPHSAKQTPTKPKATK